MCINSRIEERSEREKIDLRFRKQDINLATILSVLAGGVTFVLFHFADDSMMDFLVANGINRKDVPFTIQSLNYAVATITTIFGFGNMLLFAMVFGRSIKIYKRTLKFKGREMENMNANLMLFPEVETREFDFDAMLDDKSYQTICGCPVRIDRIIRDSTKTTVLGVSGIMIVRGVKIRGVWDCYGNIMECKKMLCIASPRQMLSNINNIFRGTTDDMFRLVSVTEGVNNPQQPHRPI